MVSRQETYQQTEGNGRRRLVLGRHFEFVDVIGVCIGSSIKVGTLSPGKARRLKLKVSSVQSSRNRKIEPAFTSTSLELHDE
ncbi:MAG: hypothetical protein AAFZ18_21860 [Myxococcota bacterium]